MLLIGRTEIGGKYKNKCSDQIMSGVRTSGSDLLALGSVDPRLEPRTQFGSKTCCCASRQFQSSLLTT
jgi:hypothetical protein